MSAPARRQERAPVVDIELWRQKKAGESKLIDIEDWIAAVIVILIVGLFLIGCWIAGLVS